jgi:serine/threonine protein kinase
MTWTVGTMVTEQVRLARQLGEKADSRAWVADQLDWKKQVAVKVVATDLPPDDLEALVDVVEKVGAAAELESPHLVQTFDHAFTDDGIAYRVMELLQGESLDQRLKKGKLGLRDAGEILNQLAAALGVAHGAGIVHQRVEPGNVFLCKASEGFKVKLLNLGVGAIRKPARTWPYISPEQYLDRPIDLRTDLWSLGEVVYEMIAGRHPIDAEKRRKLKWEHEPPSELWISDLPDAADGWFARVLEPRPDKRFESAERMAAAYATMLSGKKGAAAPKAKAGTAPAVHKHKVVAVGTPKPEPPAKDDDDAVTIDVED